MVDSVVLAGNASLEVHHMLVMIFRSAVLALAVCMLYGCLIQ